MNVLMETTKYTKYTKKSLIGFRVFRGEYKPSGGVYVY